MPKLSYRTCQFEFGKWGKLLKAYSDLDLDLTMLNIELFSYTTVCSYIDFFLSYHAKTHTHTHTHKHGVHAHTHTHRHLMSTL